MSTSQTIFLTRAKYKSYELQLEYMENEGSTVLATLLASSPGSGMGRPLDLPIHDLARRFYAEVDDLRMKLRRATIIDEYLKKLPDRSVADIGATVSITDLDTGDSETYVILGADESDPGEGRISFHSPLGSAIVGRRQGDQIALGSNGARFRIDKVEYNSLDFAYEPTDWGRKLSAALV